MNNLQPVKILICLVAVLSLLFAQCAGGFKSDSPNAPQFEDSVFGSDSSG
jgi:hypothetical protein